MLGSVYRERIEGPGVGKGSASTGCAADSVCVCTAQPRPTQWHDSEQRRLNMHEAGGWCHVSLSICDVHEIGQWVSLLG